MRILGQLFLLAAFVGIGYSAFACVAGCLRQRRMLLQTGVGAALLGLLSLTGTMCILARALVVKDFDYEYVAHYSSRLLAWHYSLSALWVGQAGSLLLWAWLLALLSMLFRFWPSANECPLRNLAFGVLQSCVWFLVAILVFAADPMKASIASRDEGLGLSPLLQHPSMLIHPPVVFAGYSLWAIPFAVATAAMLSGKLDAIWTRMARPWALWAWIVLGVGILLGAQWAYQELGWGGYWGWDPVENGSLIPWLTGTAFIHGLMAWRHRECLKKTTVVLGTLTFALCNFATFLTRSGIFSSVHAFSESPIGWMFLFFMAALLVVSTCLIVRRRSALAAGRASRSLFARETFVMVSTLLLCVLTTVVLIGTLIAPLSGIIVGRTIQVGPSFYNNVLTPVGLSLLALTAVVPLLRWGSPPTRVQARALFVCFMLGSAVVILAFAQGVRHPISLIVTGTTTVALSSVAAAFLLDVVRRAPAGNRWLTAMRVMHESRRQYAGYFVHVGFICLAIGIAGSSLGTQRREAVMKEGQTLDWAGRRIRYVKLIQRETADKLVAEVELELTDPRGNVALLRPARHLHLLQDQWTTEVAIHSAWSADFYTVLHAGLGGGRVVLTFVLNPMMRCLWIGGIIAALSAVVAIWPSRTSRAATSNIDEPMLQAKGIAQLNEPTDLGDFQKAA